MHANFHFVDRANETLDPRAADLRQQAWQALFVNLLTAHSVLPQLNLLFFMVLSTARGLRCSKTASEPINQRDNTGINSNS